MKPPLKSTLFYLLTILYTLVPIYAIYISTNIEYCFLCRSDNATKYISTNIQKMTISTNMILVIMRIENILVPMYNTVTRSRK